MPLKTEFEMVTVTGMVRVLEQFSPTLTPPPFELDVVATSGVATLFRNCELVMVSDCPGYCAKNPKPAPPRALLFWTITSLRTRL